MDKRKAIADKLRKLAERIEKESEETFLFHDMNIEAEFQEYDDDDLGIRKHRDTGNKTVTLRYWEKPK